MSFTFPSRKKFYYALSFYLSYLFFSPSLSCLRWKYRLTELHNILLSFPWIFVCVGIQLRLFFFFSRILFPNFLFQFPRKKLWRIVITDDISYINYRNSWNIWYWQRKIGTLQDPSWNILKLLYEMKNLDKNK